QAGDHQVPEGVPLEVAGLEAVLEGSGPQRVAVGEGDEALAKVARGRNAEGAAQAAAGAAVVGHRHDGRDRARVVAGGSKGRRQALPTPDGAAAWAGGTQHYRPTSPASTVGSNPRLARSLPS